MGIGAPADAPSHLRLPGDPAAYPDPVEILAWLVPAAVATSLAMCWAGWRGRPQPEGRDRSEAAYERFARAIEREHPAAGRPGPVAPRDRSTGIAVRPSRRPEQQAAPRRSA